MTDLAWMRPKLAELCGLSEDAGRELFDPRTFDRFPGGWRPDEDVAQAVRCLEAMDRPFSIGWRPNTSLSSHIKPWFCWNENFRHWETTAARAICLAIAATLGWEKP